MSFSGSAQGQQAQLGAQDAKLLLTTVASACQDTARSGSMLLDTETISHNSSSGPDMSDTGPSTYPTYEAPPPPFEEPSDSAYAKADAGGSSSSNTKNDKESSGGFLGSLASSFKAVTASLRTQPEPLVVPLCHAAMIGNVAQMRSLLNEGAQHQRAQ